MEIRHFRKGEASTLVELFRKTVHTVCKKDYSQAQLDVWAPARIDVGPWEVRFASSFTLVAESDGRIVGFANLESSGCIDLFYVAADFQSQGVGSRLFEALEAEAMARGLSKIQSDVSLTARHFFLSKGFVIEKEYAKKVGAMSFSNAIMTKTRV